MTYQTKAIGIMEKADSKELHDYIINQGGSRSDARTAVLVNEYGVLFYKCFVLAEERFNGDLMPTECINILSEVYGKRMEKMKPQTIFDKVYSMMQTVEGNPDKEIITDSVEYYLQS